MLGCASRANSVSAQANESFTTALDEGAVLSSSAIS